MNSPFRELHSFLEILLEHLAESHVMIVFCMLVRNRLIRSPFAVFGDAVSENWLCFEVSVVLQKNTSIIRPSVMKENVIILGVLLGWSIALVVFSDLQSLPNAIFALGELGDALILDEKRNDNMNIGLQQVF